MNKIKMALSLIKYIAGAIFIALFVSEKKKRAVAESEYNALSASIDRYLVKKKEITVAKENSSNKHISDIINDFK